MDAHSAEARSAEQIESDIEKTRSEMAGTLDNLQRSLSPGQWIDQALGYFDQKSGQLGSGLAQTIKDNPLPTALACVGLAWLAVAGFGHGGARPAANERRSGPERRVDGGAGAARWRTPHAAGAGVGEETSLPLERRHSQRRIGSLGRQMAASSDEAATLRGQGKELSRTARRNVSRAGRGLRRQAARFVDRQPLVMGALGLAVGAAIGAGLPATREEDQWMGEARDDLLRQAQDTGGAALREARQRIESAPEPMPVQPQAGHPETPGVVPGPGGFGAAPRPASPP